MGKRASKEQEVAEVLDYFKGAQARDAATVLWIREDNSLLRLVLAWPKVILKHLECTLRVPSKIEERWSWLWQHYSFSVKEWCKLAGIANYSYGARLITRLINLRLVFPDNSRAQWLDQFITLSAVHLTATLAPNQGRPSAPAPRPAEKSQKESSDEESLSDDENLPDELKD